MPVRDQYYTYEDYCQWEGDWELIDGVPYAMASPSGSHQSAGVGLLNQISNYLKGKKCRPFYEFDVKLDDDLVFRPDILVNCDPDKYTERYIDGAPDWIIEITSPSTKVRDENVKLKKYLMAGVREYWIVDPEKREVFVFTNGEDAAVAHYNEHATVKVSVLEDLTINLAEVFPPAD